MSMAHVSLIVDVPHVPSPTGPVDTVNLVDGSVPLTVEAIGTRLPVLQPTRDVAPATHSTASYGVLGTNPVPVMTTDALFASPALGVTTGVGGAAVAPD